MFNTLKQTAVGSSVSLNAIFLVPSSVSLSNVTAKYTLQDDQGVDYLSGTADSFVVTSEANRNRGTATVGLTLPNTLPVTKQGTQYQMLWTLESPNGDIVSTYLEMLVVHPATYEPIGVPDIVEVAVDSASLQSVLPTDDAVDLQLYTLNALAYEETGITKTSDVANGFLYKHTVSGLKSLGINPSLQPFTVLWRYADPFTGETIVEDGYVYLITPSILSAAKELQSSVNLVRNQARSDALDIDMNVLVHFLKVGGDVFNATGLPTHFNLTNASGPIRAFWLACSEVQLLRSRYLMEAERAFNLSGQSENLDIDMTQYYDSAASSRQGWIDQYIPDFKRNISRRGITAGDGNYNTSRSLQTGATGISVSPISNYYSFYSRRFPRFRG